MRWSYPEGYKTIFLVRLLGNFCFYGLKSILVLYLTFQFLLTDQRAFSLYGTFMALAYLTPIFGGWLSDQVFGIKKSILIGGWIVFVGCLLLSVTYEGTPYLGLALVSVGVGFFKPNAMSAVGVLFPDQGSKMRDSAYITLYAGMNLGSFLGPLVCGWVGHRYGWHFVFPLVGGSILAASLLFHFHFKEKKIFINSAPRKDMALWKSFGSLLLSVGGVLFLLLYAEKMKWLMPVIILGSMGCLGIIVLQTDGQERKNVLQIGILMVLFAVFASLFEQAGSSITLFIERGVDRMMFGKFELPSPFFQSLNPALVIGLSPLVAGFWIRFENKIKPVSIFGKFSLGFLFVGASFVLLGIGVQGASADLLSPSWIVAMFFLQVLGELCIVPIGFSAVSKLAPPKFTTMIMGLWMVSISCGHYVAALLANFSSTPLQGDAGSNFISFETYEIFFLKISLIPFAMSILIGIVLLYQRYCGSQKR